MKGYCEGFTAQQANKYMNSSEYSRGYWGLIQTDISSECRVKVGEIIQFMSKDYVESALIGTPFES
jgi:hypothetical protein